MHYAVESKLPDYTFQNNCEGAYVVRQKNGGISGELSRCLWKSAAETSVFHLARYSCNLDLSERRPLSGLCNSRQPDGSHPKEKFEYFAICYNMQYETSILCRKWQEEKTTIHMVLNLERWKWRSALSCASACVGMMLLRKMGAMSSCSQCNSKPEVFHGTLKDLTLIG